MPAAEQEDKDHRHADDSVVDARVRDLCAAAAFDEAATVALRTYGGEVFRFLVALIKNEGDASEVFSLFAEDLWKSLEGFAWACSLRTWAYTLARRAASRTMRNAWRKKAIPVGSSPALEEVVQHVRSETLTYMRTETKTRIRALRDSLDEADQILLMLRVDRNLSWEELARVTFESDDASNQVENLTDDDVLKREAARLRKRFQIVKDRLKDLAKREGLYRGD